MDNKQQIAHLDPKLKEAYERVMNNFPSTSPAPSGAQPSQSPSATPPPSQPIAPVSSPSDAIAEEKIVTTTPHPVQTAQTAAQAAPPHTSSGTVHLQYQLHKPQHLGKEKQKLQLPSSVYILGGVVFFILYTLFWVRVFNINLPFLP